MADYWEKLLGFMSENESYLLPLAFLISMAESIVGVSLFVPSTLILIAASTMLGASGADIAPLWLAAALGAAFGDWVSYGLGYFAGERLHGYWPLRNNRALLDRGHRFFERWGWASMFLARFMGPLRSFTPLVAGICRMPLLPFALAGLASAFLWASLVLLPGGIGAGWVLGG